MGKKAWMNGSKSMKEIGSKKGLNNPDLNNPGLSPVLIIDYERGRVKWIVMFKQAMISLQEMAEL